VISTELNVLDELYLHLDREDEPWSVHLEVGLDGRVDERRLRDAIVVGTRAHPLARARLRRTLPTDVRYHWEAVDEPDEVPLEVVECVDDAGLEGAREQLMGASPSLETSPPFAVTLARHPDGDSVLLNLSHAAGDGISAVRLMASFLRAYAGQDDPPAPVDPLAVRDIGRLVRSRSVTARLARARTLLERTAQLAQSPTRIAADGASQRPGYGFSLLALGAQELRAMAAQRRGGATVNDVLLAGFAVTILRWNQRHGAPVGPLSLMMPVNLRAAEWRNEIVGNYASYVSVHFGAEEQTDMNAAVAAARARTREIKTRGAAGLVIDLLELPTATLPTAVKRRFQDLISLTGSRLVDTAVLSNLGRLEAAPALGDSAGEVRRVWFSPPGRMPLGASLGAATYGDELFLCLRYRHALFDSDAATAFTALLRDTLITPQ
jgi:NRPS condensation-like uncharacterized protein